MEREAMQGRVRVLLTSYKEHYDRLLKKSIKFTSTFGGDVRAMLHKKLQHWDNLTEPIEQTVEELGVKDNLLLQKGKLEILEN